MFFCNDFFVLGLNCWWICFYQRYNHRQKKDKNCCGFRFSASCPAILIWLSDNKVYFLVLDIFLCLCVFSRWSVMTYEVPATTKRTPIVKEDDSLDSPLQVNYIAFRTFGRRPASLTDGIREFVHTKLNLTSPKKLFWEKNIHWESNWAWQLEAKAIRAETTGSGVAVDEGWTWI